MRFVTFLFVFFSLTFSHAATTIMVGTPPYSPPFVMLGDNKAHYTGFDIDLLDEICRRIDAKCQYKAMSYEGVFNGLLDGSIDIAIGGITITAGRESQFLFSLPYLASYAQFITNSASSIRSIQDLNGKRIGLGSGTIFENLINDAFGQSVTIKTYNFLSEMLMALGSDEVDALILDRATAETWYANSNDSYRLVGRRIPQGLGYGILTTKNRGNLITLINRALLAMEADGTYLKIYTTYFTGSEL